MGGHVANSGAITYHGSRDEETAGYFSKLAGVTTINCMTSSISRAVSSAVGGGSSTTSLSSVAQAQRNLAYPDELMHLDGRTQLVLIDNLNPKAANRLRWFEHPTLKGLGVNLDMLSRETFAPDPAEGC